MSPQAAGAESVFRNTFFGKQTSKAWAGLFHFLLLSKKSISEDPPLAASRLRNLLISLDLPYLLVF